jgi:hypothetical protein
MYSIAVKDSGLIDESAQNSPFRQKGPTSYSYRKASMGSSREAFQAG